MRIVRATVETPQTAAWSASTIVEAVQAAAVPQDELAHVYARLLADGFGVVIYLLVPLDRAAAAGSRLILAAVDLLELTDWRLGEIRVWSPDQIS